MIDKIRIETEIDNAINNIKIKCSRSGTKPTSGVIYGQGEAPTYELNNGNLTKELLNQIADEMAERWGLEVSINEKGRRQVNMREFSFWDDENQTLIRLNKMINHQDWIDFTNGNAKFKSSYTLDDVLRYYNEMESIGKKRASAIIFETHTGSSYNRLYDGQYKLANPVVISNMCYGNRNANTPSEYHLKRVMAHEFGHASERLLTPDDVRILDKSAVSKNKFDTSLLTNEDDRNRLHTLLGLGSYRGKANAVSYSKEYEQAMRDNKEVFASSYAKSKHNYNYTGKSEDFAETMSAVAYRNTNDKKNFRITYADGTVVGWDRFVKDHKNTYKLACDYVDGKITHSDLHNPKTNEKFN